MLLFSVKIWLGHFYRGQFMMALSTKHTMKIIFFLICSMSSTYGDRDHRKSSEAEEQTREGKSNLWFYFCVHQMHILISLPLFSVFSLFSIVTFKNNPCVSTSSLSSGSTSYRNGTCFTSRFVFSFYF